MNKKLPIGRKLLLIFHEDTMEYLVPSEDQRAYVQSIYDKEGLFIYDYRYRRWLNSALNTVSPEQVPPEYRTKLLLLT